MFPNDDAALPDVLGQSFQDDYGRFMPCLDFSNPMGPELVDGGMSYFKQYPDQDLPCSSPKQLSREQDKPRTTLRTSKKSEIKTGRGAAKSATDKAQSPGRKSHNQVEKKYRDRLNDQFERLLTTLAVSAAEGEGLDEEGLRPLSKSAVLGLARRRLMTLEKENRMLTTEVERLGALLQRVG